MTSNKKYKIIFHPQKKKKEKRKDSKDKEPRPKIKKINHSSSVRD